ncbi:type VI secretion system-associated protein TagF [Mangrovicoccus algicola]|uniref:Type VI secretion system-associated protein TagF n=1 Tax=Mangrovicoccus algicola TaxID=2771008 RepID=A0A8J6Z6Z3_9RHOB|nr:type VI secretion system-associated protein TagF [Mangrovicoccus algicola]MBE3639054.1 type VI secretion system-associated protein TagF [Mangrovicoccus algicola]
MAGGWGACGKIPALGDFLRFGLPPGLVRAWDGWLAAAMEEAAAELGPGWDAAYMSAPIWRFTLPAGLVWDQAVTGVLMPSIDRVGRRFPLALMTVLQGPRALLPAVHLGDGTPFAALEAAALDMLGDDADRAALEARLAGLPAPAAPAGLQLAHGVGAEVAAARQDDLAAGLACALTLRQDPSPGYWSCIGADGRARLWLLPGMPRAETAARLFAAGRDADPAGQGEARHDGLQA